MRRFQLGSAMLQGQARRRLPLQGACAPAGRMPGRAGRALVVIALLAACRQAEAPRFGSGRLRARSSGSLALVPPIPPVSMRWPQFLLVESPDRFLWGAEREIYRIAASEQGSTLDGPLWPELTEGLGRLVAVARTPSGALAVLDADGRVRGESPGSKSPWGFQAHLPGGAAKLATTDEAVYLLLQGMESGGAAVVGFDHSGMELGRWGTIPASGLIQLNLSGGGLAACPDGSVFYSYINSPEIWRVDGGDKAVRPLGGSEAEFKVIPERALREASDEGRKARSVAPLVRLGLGASRVAALTCSPEGRLFRQVVRPRGAGSYVEVWEPRSGERLGAIPSGGGVLFDVRGHTLFLGNLRDGHFVIEPIEYGIARRAEAH